MRTEKVFDLVVWLFIATVGLVAAYVCFGILSSQASGRYQQYSVGGAIAGALISWSVLTSVYLQLRGSSDELQQLRKRSEELQSKLIRGAPRPQGFDTEVDERQRIVLARPKDWEPKGGTIFELELPDEKMGPDDNFPATFRCYFVPIEKGSKQTREEFHTKQLNLIKDASRFIQSSSHEVVRLGGEAGEVESLKIIVHQVVRTEVKRSRETGRCERKWELISWSDFVGQIDEVYPRQVSVGRPTELILYGAGFRDGSVCYVNKKKHETTVVERWQVKVQLDAEDVSKVGVLELVIENPDTLGKQSNTQLLIVAEIPGEAPLDTPVVDDVAETIKSGSSVSTPQTGSGANENATDVPKSAEGPKPTDTSTSTDTAADADPSEEDKPRVIFQEVVRMRVACYHEELGKIYYFEFWDDMHDFLDSSAVFNRILASTRFLN